MSHRAIILPYKGVYPKIAEDAFVAPGAVIIGDVTIGSKSSIWFGCVLRGDVAKIIVGEETNIQDGSIIHVTRNGVDTIIGSKVTIGHQALLHGCVINDHSFIGMRSTIIDKAIVESRSMVAAGSLVTGSKIIKSGEVWAGSPAKFFRLIEKDEESYIATSAANYVEHAAEYLAMNL